MGALKQKFKIGDKVRITTLNSPSKGKMSGVLGHIGEIVRIDSDGFCVLDPYCSGGCWPMDCLELSNPELLKQKHLEEFKKIKIQL